MALIDLRIHAAASTSRKGDDRARAQAEAYDQIQSVNIARAVRCTSPITGGGVPAASNQMLPSDTARQDERHGHDGQTYPMNPERDSATFLDSTQLGYTALESQLITSSRPATRDANKGPGGVKEKTPTATRHFLEPTNEVERLSQNGSSSGVPSQSSYLVSPLLDRSSKKPRINDDNREYFLRGLSRFPPFAGANDGLGRHAPQSDPGALAGPLQLNEQVLRRHNEEESLEGNDTTSELPASYSLSQVTSESTRTKQPSNQRSLGEAGITPNEDAPEPRTQSHVSPARLLNQHERSSTSSQNRQSGEVSSTEVKDFAAPVKAPTKPSSTASPESALPEQILPPPPSPGLTPPGNYLTHALAFIGAASTLQQMYKPIETSRPLRPIERGHWLFDITPLSEALRIELFEVLSKKIGDGSLGWGVWCVRDGLVVRLYCWGEVVREVYLLLYVASKSKVRKLGLVWMDAEGKAVVRMRGCDNEPGEHPG